MSDLKDTRRPIWVCIWPEVDGNHKLTLHRQEPVSEGALAVLQLRGEMLAEEITITVLPGTLPPELAALLS